MKTLYVIRHAKSSWSDMALADFDRPLNNRGQQAAPEMGRRLRERNVLPDLIISSSARRAITTAITIAEQVGYDKNKIQQTRDLYLAGIDSILQVIHQVDDQANSLFIFGHNPGWTDFCNYIQNDEFIENIPTCGIVGIHFEVESWNEIEKRKGNQLFFDYPKKQFP